MRYSIHEVPLTESNETSKNHEMWAIVKKKKKKMTWVDKLIN